MRIASLVPSATETLFELGLGDQVVAVTHECDHPPEATRSPAADRQRHPGAGSRPPRSTPRVRAVTGRGEALYLLDEPLLASLGPT